MPNILIDAFKEFPVKLLTTVFTTMVLAFITYFVRKIILESWTSEFYEEGKLRNEHMNFRHIAGYFTGSSTCNYENNLNQIEVLTYNFFGKRKGDMLIGYFFGTNNSERGSIVMRFFHSTGKWEGKYLILLEGDKVDIDQYAWRK